AELTGLDDANLEPQRATIARSGDDLRRNPGVIQLNVYTMHVSQARPRALPQGHVDLMPASIIEHGVGHNAVVGLNADVRGFAKCAALMAYPKRHQTDAAANEDVCRRTSHPSQRKAIGTSLHAVQSEGDTRQDSSGIGVEPARGTRGTFRRQVFAQFVRD